jgi:hypothetical protein
MPCITQLLITQAKNSVVPQYHGYHTPENEDAERYLSPIMLLENCGRPLDLKQMILTNDHKSECSSLLYRLNHAGWLHESGNA